MILCTLWLVVALGTGSAPKHEVSVQADRETSPMAHAHGAFDVKVTPQPAGPGEGFGSYLLEKTYTGDLEATSSGQMLSAGDPKAGNAGYVAIERITGKLNTPDGMKTGSFALMQQGTMIAGSVPQLSATIVPGSGTGELSGIHGSMTITIAAGKHSYALDYGWAHP
jgi:hypothetical protein